MQFEERIKSENLPYSLIYIPDNCNSESYITIKCNKHNFIFSVSIRSFFNHKSKCPKCQKNYHFSQDEYSEIIQEKINDYHLPYTFIGFDGEFKNAHSKIILYCNNCKETWSLSINNFLNNRGCPICNKSKGEKLIRKILLDYNIDFVQEKRFDTCKDKIMLPFDFYIPSLNLLIEYDGQQHFKDGWFKNLENLEKTQYHDKIKNDWANKNNICLIRYNYNQSFKEIENNLLGLLNSYESRKK